MGDLNAKTSNQDDTIIPDKMDKNFDVIIDEPPPKRNSQDTAVNARGKEMLDMCKSLNINIVNGRKTGDLFGNYTCFNWNGNSLVDYVLTSASLFQKISVHKVQNFIPLISDHCSVHFTLEVNREIQSADTMTPEIKAPKSFVWTELGKLKFLNMLKTSEFQNELEKILHLDYMAPNCVVDYISEVLIAAAEKAKIKVKKNTGEGNPPWFDKSCRILKQDIRSLGGKVKRNPKNEYFKNHLADLKKKLKALIKRNKFEYKNN